MTLTRGVVYVAFGREYDNQAAHSAQIIRRYSDIPIFVLSNLEKGNRSPVWESLGGVRFQYLASADPENDTRNRLFKISLDLYSPFDISLFCDTDTAVQSSEFLKGFDEAEKYDVMFSVRNVAKTRGQLPDVNYKKAFDMFGMKLPGTIYKEGVFFFCRTLPTRRLFAQWEDCWQKMNVGRDMPPLFAACQLTPGVRIGVLPYGWDSRDGHIIVHGHGDFQVPGLPRITKFKPTITSNPEWKKVPPA
jgi:hypothetical protein